MFSWIPWFRKDRGIVDSQGRFCYQMNGRTIYLPDAKVLIEREAFEKLKSYVLSVDTEISGLGIVQRRGDVFYIPEVFLLEQEVSAAWTKLDPVAIAKLMGRIISRNQDPSLLRFWWHSHSAMAPFWSALDEATVENLKNNGFLVSLVINRRLEYLCRLDLYKPLRVTIDGITLESRGDFVVSQDPREEVGRKVREQRRFDLTVDSQAELFQI